MSDITRQRDRLTPVYEINVRVTAPIFCEIKKRGGGEFPMRIRRARDESYVLEEAYSTRVYLKPKWCRLKKLGADVDAAFRTAVEYVVKRHNKRRFASEPALT